MPITFEIVTDEYAENKNLADYFLNSNRRMCRKKIMPITFEIVTDECAENKSCRLLLK